jgi:hypothetical protein
VNGASYADAWNRYRRLSRLRLIALIGYLPLAAVLFPLCRWLGLPPDYASPFMFAWFGFWAVSVIRAGSFKCPRCAGPFFYARFASNPLTRRCMRCGLAKWATDPSAWLDTSSSTTEP